MFFLIFCTLVLGLTVQSNPNGLIFKLSVVQWSSEAPFPTGYFYLLRLVTKNVLKTPLRFVVIFNLRFVVIFNLRFVVIFRWSL